MNFKFIKHSGTNLKLRSSRTSDSQTPEGVLR